METVFDVPLATFLRVVYGDDGDFFRRFHAETGGRDDAVVPPFEPVSGARVVAFSKAMSLPAVIARLLGSSVAALASPLALPKGRPPSRPHSLPRRGRARLGLRRRPSRAPPQ